MDLKSVFSNVLSFCFTESAISVRSGLAKFYHFKMHMCWYHSSAPDINSIKWQVSSPVILKSTSNTGLCLCACVRAPRVNSCTRFLHCRVPGESSSKDASVNKSNSHDRVPGKAVTADKWRCIAHPETFYFFPPALPRSSGETLRPFSYPTASCCKFRSCSIA